MHDGGIVHLDIRCPNVSVVRGTDGNDHIKIAEFGRARRITGTESELKARNALPHILRISNNVCSRRAISQLIRDMFPRQYSKKSVAVVMVYLWMYTRSSS